MSNHFQSNFIPFLSDAYDDYSVVTRSAYPQSNYNFEYDELLNSVDPFVTCLYQAGVSSQTLPEASIHTGESWFVTDSQSFDDSESEQDKFDYSISTTDTDDATGLAESSHGMSTASQVRK